MKRSVLIVSGVVLFLIVYIVPVFAGHYGTDVHWHDASYEYQIRSSVPAGWHDAINEAADGWNDRTDDMTLEEDSSSLNWIERDEI